MLLAVAVTLVTSCEEDDFDFPEEVVIDLTGGSADFTKYVSVGNSLTAGFTDGALFLAGQEYSMPNLLSQKFAMLDGGEFTQPLTNDNVGGLTLGGVVIQEPRLFFNGAGPERLGDMPTNEISNVLTGPFNNMGVPGAKSYHLLANGYGNLAGVPVGLANPYFARMASNPNASVLEDAMAQNASFFTLWIGNNDVLSYATSGGSGVNQLGNFDPSTYGPNDITDPTAFGGIYNGILSGLTANGAEGVVLNIPYVTSIPFFTTVPYNPVPLDAATAGAVNAGYAPYNAGLLGLEGAGLLSSEERAARTINFVEGQNAVVMVDEFLTDLSGFGLPSLRQTTADDLLVLVGASFIGTTVGGDPTLVNGISVPLADQWVLSSDEIAEVVVATDAYNQTIELLASQNGLGFVNANAIMQQVASGGVQFDEFTMRGNLVFGGTFSLDGVHPTQRGYAFIANQILMAIDETYGSNFVEAGALLKATDYITQYPASF